MSQSTAPSHPDQQPLQRLVLPEYRGTPAGLLHTILVDEEDGSIYYSDEFNNAIVSLDLRGDLRWVRGIEEHGAGEFRYPRGISLGSIQFEGKSVRCLAVANSWNHEVRILSLDGRPLVNWSRADQDLFVEPSDVRFISYPEALRGRRSKGYWLVIDTGAHRIYAIGEDGLLLFKIGRCLIPGATHGWAVPALGLENDLLPHDTLRDFPPFDFLYYPTRILGNSEDALYTWEPNSQLLKRILYGNLMPVSFPFSEPVEWFAADARGFLGWSRKTNRLRRLHGADETHQELRTDGIPISSNLPSNQFWIQTRKEIQRWTWPTAKVSAADDSAAHPSGDSILLRTAENAMNRPAGDDAQAAIKDLLDNFQTGVRMAANLLSEKRDIGLRKKEWYQALETLQQLEEERRPIVAGIHRALHDWCLGILELKILRFRDASGEPDRAIEKVKHRWNTTAELLRRQFTETQKCLDDLFMLRLDLQTRPAADNGTVEKPQDWVVQMEKYILNVRSWLYCWSGVIDGTTDVVSLAQIRGPGDDNSVDRSDPGFMLRKPSTHRYRQANPVLREADRISLAEHCEGAQPRPCCLGTSRDGHIFVGLFARDQVLYLDAAGKLLRRIGRSGSKAGELRVPGGLALDGENRLWVADHLNHRIQVFDLKGNSLQIIDRVDPDSSPIRGPAGLCCLPDGSVLTADSGNQRIIRITSGGRCETFFARPGTECGEMRYPSSLYADLQGNIWCADPLNHRVHKLDPSGRILLTLGGCGLEDGRLLRPGSVAVFEDGMVVVSQNGPNRCLKIFSPDGREAAKFFPDYESGHLLVRGEQLLVTQWDGDSIRVYERR